LDEIFQIRVDTSRPNESDKRYHVFDLEQQSWKNVVVFFYYDSITFDKQWTIYSATTFLESCGKVVREKWFEKSGSRNLVQEKWLTRKKVVLYHKSTFFQVGEKWLTRKKNPSLKNHFSRTTFLHFSRNEVAE